METIWPVAESSTARELCHEPGVPSGDDATQTRVAFTMLNSRGMAAQPPRSGAPGERRPARVVKVT